MSNSWFFFDGSEHLKDKLLVKQAEHFACRKEKQVYILSRPLNDSRYNYSYKDALVFLIPGYKIIFYDFSGSNGQRYTDYVEDFIEDVGALADKYRYKEFLGRPRNWRRDELIVSYSNCEEKDDFTTLLDKNFIKNPSSIRKSELLISLITGSVNDIKKIGVEQPETLLEKVKRKILLFDGDQTRFVYQPPKKKVIRIQGMSGAGKTELLLHKLKELYSKPDEPKVMFTCHNKILASSLHKRIPEFFDFMKVEQQIVWENRLWCVHAWGSRVNENSGAYRYICYYYGISFFPFSPKFSFKDACQYAIEEIKKIDRDNSEFAFDYMLIDESQDFPEEFFKLAELVTRKNVYIAGDIFQGIFDKYTSGPINPDFLLRKCYRTDPRTFMFSHGLGTGMFETPKLKWLSKDDWEACGYIVNNSVKNKFTLTREPVRRFEDIDERQYSSIEIVECESDDNFSDSVINIIDNIKAEHKTVCPEDIGVMFYQPSSFGYAAADSIAYDIRDKYNWEVNKAYESKILEKGKLFISNQNNVKGLEFSFVICMIDSFNTNTRYRNALYMMLTRSFVKTFLVIGSHNYKKMVRHLKDEVDSINSTGEMTVSIPTDQELTEYEKQIDYNADYDVPLDDMVESVCKELGLDEREKINIMIRVVKAYVSIDGYYDKNIVKDIVGQQMGII